MSLIKKILLAAIDLALIHVCIYLAFLLSYMGQIPQRNLDAYFSISPWISLIAIGLLCLYGLIPQQKVKSREDIFPAIFLVTLFLNFGIMSTSYLSREFAFPRSVVIIEAVLMMLILYAWKYFLFIIIERTKAPLRLCVIGNLEEAFYIESRLQGLCYIVHKINASDLTPEAITGSIDEYAIKQNKKIDGVIMGRDIPAIMRQTICEALVLRQLRVYILPTVYEVLIASGNISTFKDIPVLQIRGDQLNNRFNPARRVMDISLSFVLLVILAPVMLLCALAIYFESGRPIIFSQERVTIDGKPFTLHKFRSMVHNAEALTGPVLASENDQRITRIGKVMRAFRLDELPQLVNVLIGDMSMVGPRPERPIFVNEISARIPSYDLRHEIKCGITGMAQVQGNYSTRVEDKLVWDLLYAKKHNPLLDLNLIFQTLKTVLIRGKAS